MIFVSCTPVLHAKSGDRLDWFRSAHTPYSTPTETHLSPPRLGLALASPLRGHCRRRGAAGTDAAPARRGARRGGRAPPSRAARRHIINISRPKPPLRRPARGAVAAAGASRAPPAAVRCLRARGLWAGRVAALFLTWRSSRKKPGNCLTPSPATTAPAAPHLHTPRRYPPAHVYRVVSDVSQYRHFVPWCIASTVTLDQVRGHGGGGGGSAAERLAGWPLACRVALLRARNAAVSYGCCLPIARRYFHHQSRTRAPNRSQGAYVEAELAVGFQLFAERYMSRVTLEPGKRVRVRGVRRARCVWYRAVAGRATSRHRYPPPPSFPFRLPPPHSSPRCRLRRATRSCSGTW